MRNFFTVLALVLLIVGALNWLLMGIFAFDLVVWMFGTLTAVSRILYVLVGISGLWMMVYLARRRCVLENEVL